MKRKGKAIKFIRLSASLVLVATAVMCVCRRLPECFESDEPAALAAAAFTLSDGTYRIEKTSQKASVSQSYENTQSETKAETEEKSNLQERDKSDYYDSYGTHEGEEKYEIAAQTYGADGTPCDDCFVKNHTGLDIDFEEALSEPLTFEVTDEGSAQVLIYHTHTSESYIDEDVDFFYESFYSRTQNTDFNVTAVGDAIADSLNEKGIKTLHDTTVHDSTYNGSYDRSLQTVESIMETNTDIKVVIDIHRDAIGSETRKIKPVFTYNGRQGAQIMILSGCDTDGSMGFESWENNLNFALKIQNTAEKMYPGMTRPLDFGYFAYNEFICDGSLLIEIGTDANSIDEAVYTGELLGNVLYEVLR